MLLVKHAQCRSIDEARQERVTNYDCPLQCCQAPFLAAAASGLPILEPAAPASASLKKNYLIRYQGN